MKKEADNTVTGESAREGGTIRTAAQKRADKKEREKEKKRKEAAKAKEKKSTTSDQPAGTNTTAESTDKPQTDVEDKKVADTSKDVTNGMSGFKIFCVCTCIIY